MIDSLISDPSVRMLEQTVSFTEQRHNALLEDIANVSTPGFVQKDLSVKEFQKSLKRAVDQKWASRNLAYQPESSDTVQFDADGSGVSAQALETPTSVPFHDRGIRSMEYLMSELADNALAHNMAAQLLKSRYDLANRAISMKP